jgi:uncharacterized DUF497 family protein
MEDEAFEWDRSNSEHIARHSVTPDEAEEVILNDHLYAPGTPDIINGQERWKVYGETIGQRLLVVIFTPVSKMRIRVVTAYEMNRSERRDYLRWSTNQP